MKSSAFSKSSVSSSVIIPSLGVNNLAVPPPREKASSKPGPSRAERVKKVLRDRVQAMTESSRTIVSRKPSGRQEGFQQGRGKREERRRKREESLMPVG
jgi:hypothetical protein